MLVGQVLLTFLAAMLTLKQLFEDLLNALDHRSLASWVYSACWLSYGPAITLSTWYGFPLLFEFFKR